MLVGCRYKVWLVDGDSFIGEYVEQGSGFYVFYVGDYEVKPVRVWSVKKWSHKCV